MDVKQIKTLGKELKVFLGAFSDCFGRSEPRHHLQTYVAGQLSDLRRKSAEPMALAAGIPPRTLQCFLSSVRWDELRMRDRLQWIVARDHSHPHAIGVVDETGNPKKGGHTAAVQRQWCGNTGKIDNCVVGVHTAYVAGDFQCILDSDLYLPEAWASDSQRRDQVGIPPDVLYRRKTMIALEQISRALANGVRVAAWTFDELYGRDGEFLDRLEALGQNYVGEVPSNFTGWLQEPRVLQKPTPQMQRKLGRKRRFPRLARKALPACEVKNLLTYSRVFQKQPWKRYRVKDGENGPIVWEIKHATFYRKQGKHGRDGLPGPAHSLMVARNVLEPDKIKFFLSNLVLGSGEVTLDRLLWIGFSRFPIERCLEVGKRDLGMDHFEVRSWRAIHRHLYISQVSQLFCARVHQRLREKNGGRPVPDGRTDSRRDRRVDRSAIVAADCSIERIPEGRRADNVPPTSKPTGAAIAYENHPATPSSIGHRCASFEVVHSG